MIVVVGNQKGGVGKTVVAVQLAARAGERGLKTLLVDLGEQGSASYAVTGDEKIQRTAEYTALDLWDAEKPVPAVETRYENVFLCPASDKLDGVDGKTLTAAVAALTRLKTVDFDVVIIDTPPAVGPRQVAPQIVADTLVSPLEPDPFSVHGLSSLARMLTVAVRMNKSLTRYVLINRFRKADSEQVNIVNALRGTLAGTLLPQYLTERNFVRSATSHHRPIWLENGRDADALKWRAMCDRVLNVAPVLAEKTASIPAPKNMRYTPAQIREIVALQERPEFRFMLNRLDETQRRGIPAFSQRICIFGGRTAKSNQVKTAGIFPRLKDGKYEFMLFAGSTGKAMITDRASYKEGYAKRREELLATGGAKYIGNAFVLMEDTLFSGVCAAASIMAGEMRDGWYSFWDANSIVLDAAVTRQRDPQFGTIKKNYVVPLSLRPGYSPLPRGEEAA